MALENPWVKYITRSFRQIKDNVLTNLQNLVPEMTDFSENNLYVKLVSVWAGIEEHIGYYVDNAARETFLDTQRKLESGIRMANQFDYRVKGRLPAFATVTFTSSVITTSVINIPAGTKISTNEGIVFETIENVSINVGEQSVDVDAKQWVAVVNSVIGTSDGSPLQKYPLVESAVDKDIVIVVGGTTNFLFVDTFAFSIPDDNVFRPSLNIDNVLEIQFGDGVQGAIPTGSDDIVATYYTSEGEGGNVGGNTIVNIDSSLTLPSGIELTVNNLNPASGGKNSEGLTDIKKNIPLTIRTKDRAVTEQDFIDIANLAPGVESAGVSYDCGNIVDIYIVPEGGGFPSESLIQSTEDFFNERTPILLGVDVSGAGTLFIEITSNVTALPNYLNSDVKNRVEQNILEFFEPINQQVNGKVIIGDVFEIIENTEGVKNSTINFFNPLPFALPVSPTTSVLNWNRVPLEGSTGIVKWEIKFVTVDEFELKRNGSFVGKYPVDTELNFTEIRFTVIGTYLVNDTFTFVTYPYNVQVIELDEASIPATDLSVLSINVTGGV